MVKNQEIVARKAQLSERIAISRARTANDDLVSARRNEFGENPRNGADSDLLGGFEYAHRKETDRQLGRGGLRKLLRRP